MISPLPFQLERFIDSALVDALQGTRDQRRGHLAEARALLTAPEVRDWIDISRAYVERLDAAIERDDQKIAAYEAALPGLEKAAAAEVEAVGDVQRANEAYKVGSLDREEALRLRDDAEAARQALSIRTREREAAVLRVRGALPYHAAVLSPLPENQDMVEKLAGMALQAVWPKDSYRQVSPETWTRWLDSSDRDLEGVPFWSLRKVRELEAAQGRVGKTPTPQGVVDDSWRRDYRVLSVKDFVAELRSFLRTREAHARTKADKARRDLEAATAQLSAMEGAR